MQFYAEVDRGRKEKEGKSIPKRGVANLHLVPGLGVLLLVLRVQCVSVLLEECLLLCVCVLLLSGHLVVSLHPGQVVRVVVL